MPTIVVSVTVTDAGGHVGTASASATIGFTTERSFRESLVPLYETYDPGDGQVGCYDDPAYPPIARAVVASHSPVAGGVYQNLIIQGTITPPTGTGRAAYWNCELQGPAGVGHLVKAYDTGRIGLDFYDCDFKPRVPGSSRTGIIGKNYTLNRCDVSYVVDGFRVQNTSDPTGPSGVKILGSRIDNLYWEADAADGTHSDVGQIESGSGTEIRGNTLRGFIAPEYRPNFYGTKHANAVLMIKPDVGLITGLLVRGNSIDGGAYATNIANDSPDRILGSVGTISDNRFGRDIRQGRTISMPVSASATITTGNVYADNGAAVTVYRQG